MKMLSILLWTCRNAAFDFMNELRAQAYMPPLKYNTSVSTSSTSLYEIKSWVCVYYSHSSIRINISRLLLVHKNGQTILHAVLLTLQKIYGRVNSLAKILLVFQFEFNIYSYYANALVHSVKNYDVVWKGLYMSKSEEDRAKDGVQRWYDEVQNYTCAPLVGNYFQSSYYKNVSSVSFRYLVCFFCYFNCNL